MKKFIFVLALFLTISCSQSASVATTEDDPYKDVRPLINGDSLLKEYPLAFDGNLIQEEEFLNAVIKQILAKRGSHIESLEIQPWELGQMMECGSDSFFVSFNRAVEGKVSLSTKLPRSTAEKLNKDTWYEVKGIFTGFPERESLQPHIQYNELDLGVLEIDNAVVNPFPKDKIGYWKSRSRFEENGTDQ